jgi:signal transduction histidine kinase
MVSAQEMVHEVMTALHLQAAQKRIHLNAKIPDLSLPVFEADRALLQQALRNLLDNAIKYSRVEGRIDLSAKIENREIIFQIEDHGVGISPMDMPRLFEKFYRGAQQSSKDRRGTGLGLAIVKSIAEKHGGKTWAESELGKGSIFYLSIPVRHSKKL